MTTTTFESIDEQINDAELEALFAAAAMETRISRAERLVATYDAVRPILVALTTLALLPQRWRDALRYFVVALDEVTTPHPSAGANFRAGKDL